MNLKRLQAFHAVFETGSVTDAGKRLHLLSQPAVSRLISDLERELNLTLFARQRQRLVPTAEGRVFFREAERALAAVDQIVDIARDIRTLKGAHLRVAAPMMAAFGIIPAAIKAFVALHPDVRVSLEIKDMRDIADWVSSGPFDIGVAVLPLDDARVEIEPLTTVRCLLVLPNGHRLTRKPFVSLRELSSERMILPAPGNINRELYAAAFASAGSSYMGSIETTSVLSACQLVADRLGLAIADPFTYRAVSKLGLVARPLRPAIELSFGFFFPAHRPRSALVSAFVKATHSALAQVS